MTLVVVMIESVGALSATDEIAVVLGVDILLMGTTDLCDRWKCLGSAIIGRRLLYDPPKHIPDTAK